MKTKTMIICALFAAVMCVFSVMTIPTGIVPVTMGFLGVFLVAVILGPKKGTVSVAVFILLGAVGLPVFSGFKGGSQVLIGPTGGYIWSYIIMALFIGLLTVKVPENKWLAMIKIFLVCIGAAVIGYALGTVQFMLVRQVNWGAALTMCVLPFIPFDIAKAVIAAYAGYTVRQALIRAKLI